MDSFLKSLRQLQESVIPHIKLQETIHDSALKKLSEITHSSAVLNMPSSLQLFSVSMALAVENLNNVVSSHEKLISKLAQDNIKQWQPILNNLSQLPTSVLSTAIPLSIYPLIQNLVQSIPDALPIAEESNLNAYKDDIWEINDLQATDQPKWTYSSVIALILMVLTILIPLYTDHQQALTEQKHHEELIQKLDELITTVEPLALTSPRDSESQSSADPETE